MLIKVVVNILPYDQSKSDIFCELLNNTEKKEYLYFLTIILSITLNCKILITIFSTDI